MRLRIYVKDKKNGEISFLEMKWPRILYDYLDEYLKINKKSFMYITNIKDGKAQAQCKKDW